MKVVQILPDLEAGGVERGTLEVAKALVDAGHQSLVISAGGRMVAQLEAEGSVHYCWDLGRKSLLTLRHLWALRRWIRAQAPDVLHVRSRMPAWLVWLAWRGLPAATRPKLVMTVHGLYSVSRYSAIMTRGERVIAVSKTVRSYIEHNYPDTEMQNVTVINRGIDPADFPRGYAPSNQWLQRWCAEYPQLAGKRVLTIAGRLTRLKGHHDFIALVQQLRQQGVPVHGLIVGGEDPKRRAYAEELRNQVKLLGLEHDITFTGNRADIRDVYAASDLVLSLSTKPESFGRAVLEALSLGVPVVGYDHGGVGEILAKLYPQGRVPLRDSAALVSIATQLLEDSGAIQENTLFLRSEMLAQKLALYQDVCT